MDKYTVMARNLLTRYWRDVREAVDLEQAMMVEIFANKYVRPDYVHKFCKEVGMEKDISLRFFVNYVYINEEDPISEIIGLNPSDMVVSQICHITHKRIIYEVQGRLQYKNNPMPVCAFGFRAMDRDTLVRIAHYNKESYIFYNSYCNEIYKFPRSRN